MCMGCEHCEGGDEHGEGGELHSESRLLESQSEPEAETAGRGGGGRPIDEFFHSADQEPLEVVCGRRGGGDEEEGEDGYTYSGRETGWVRPTGADFDDAPPADPKGSGALAR